MEKKSVQSLDRAFLLLELICKSPNGMAIHQLSETTGLHKSTVHRLLGTMIELGYVRRSSDAVYRAGMRICEISEYVQENLDIVALARAPMEELSRRTGETVHLVEREDNEIVYIYKVESVHQAIRMVSRIGMRRPMYCTGTGKAMLAYCHDTEITATWEKMNVKPLTPYTLIHQEAFLKEIQEIRRCGYAMDNQENEIGVRCVATAIPDWRGRAPYALSISVPISRMTDQQVHTLVPQLLAARDEISSFLCSKSPSVPST